MHRREILNLIDDIRIYEGHRSQEKILNVLINISLSKHIESFMSILRVSFMDVL